MAQPDKELTIKVWQGRVPATLAAIKAGSDIPEIRMISRTGDVEYRSAGGSHIFRLRLTAKQRDHLLRLESESKSAMRKRIERDNYQLSSLGGSDK